MKLSVALRAAAAAMLLHIALLWMDNELQFTTF